MSKLVIIETVKNDGTVVYTVKKKFLGFLCDVNHSSLSDFSGPANDFYPKEFVTLNDTINAIGDYKDSRGDFKSEKIVLEVEV